MGCAALPSGRGGQRRAGRGPERAPFREWRWCWFCSCNTSTLLDLGRVAVAVRGINLEPLLDRIGSELVMRACSQPLVLAQAFEDLQRRFARPVHGFQRWTDGPVAREDAGVVLFVVALDLRLVLGDEYAQPDGSRHLAVRDVVHDLPWRPFAGDGGAVELVVAQVRERVHDGLVAGAIFLQKLSPILGVHHSLPTLIIAVE